MYNKTILFLLTNCTLALDNSLYFRKNLAERIQDDKILILIMTKTKLKNFVNNKIRDQKIKYDVT